MEPVIRDVRFAVRSLRRRPGFTVLAVLALTVGIGFNTAVFSFVQAILLRPLPFPEPEELVTLKESQPGYGHASLSAPDFLDWRAQSQSFEAMSGFTYVAFQLTGRDVPESLNGAECDREFFRVMGTKAALGQVFTPDSPGGEGVLSDGAWTRLFARDPKVLGTTLVLNGRPVTIVGVLPPGYHFPSGRDVWVSARTPVPIGTQVAEDALTQRGSHYFQAVGRLRDGVSVAAAREELAVIGRRLEELHPDTNKGHRPNLIPFRETVVGKVETPLWLLMAAVFGVLLIACFNVAGLQWASIAARRSELAIRAALGASRWQIARQVLVEGVVLSAAGGLLGLLLGAWGVDLLALWGKGVLPHVRSFELDLFTLAFTVGLSVASGVGFAVLPALGATSAQPMDALREGGRTSSKGRTRSALVAAQVAATVALLAGTGTVLRSFQALKSVETGLRPEGVHVVQWLTDSAAPSPDAAKEPGARYEQVLSRVRAIPGVESAAFVQNLPLSHSNSNGDVEVEGYPAALDERTISEFQRVSVGYFETMGIPLLKGRLFQASDAASRLPALLVNEAFVRRYAQGRDPLSLRVKAGGGPWLEVVGVVGDVRQRQLQDEPQPELYLPLSALPAPVVSLVLRSGGDPSALLPPVAKAVQSVLAGQPVQQLKPMTAFIQEFLATEELLLRLTSVFSVVALVLAMLGIYGLVSYGTQQRTRELGIRMALGAAPTDILRMVLVSGLRRVALGVLAGAPLALLTVGALRSHLYVASAFDPLLLCLVLLLLFCAAMLASFIPAFRATRLVPLAALRHE